MPETIIAVAAALLFCAAPCGFLANYVVRRSGLKNGWQLQVMGFFPGLMVSILLLIFLPSDGGIFAAAALISWYYGTCFGGQKNEERARKRRARGF